MAITLDETAVGVLSDLIEEYLALDPADDEEFKTGVRKLLAIKYNMDDFLRQAGRVTDPMTDLEEAARTRNPFYVSILANDGAKP